MRPRPDRSASRRGRRPGAATAAVAALLSVAACGLGPEPPPTCTATAPGGPAVSIDPEQAGHAATIAAVGRRAGLPDHAVTVALATAWQESGLRNLAYGDRDSLGLFQQRPSQGWGTAEQVSTPTYAARAFYRRLAAVPGWADLPVTVAAQRVQRSAFPQAYAKHEDRARVLARVTTGQVPLGLTCTGLADGGPLRLAPLRAAAETELGRGALEAPTGAALSRAAAWLVAHAQEYGVSRVDAGGQRWTAASGRWTADPAAGPGLAFG